MKTPIISRRRFVLGLGVAAATCAGICPLRAGELSEAEVKELHTAAQELEEAMARGDFQTIMRGTHPALFQLMGGKREGRLLFKKAVEAVKDLDFEILESTLGDPTRTYLVGDEEICLLPVDSLNRIGPQKIRSKRFLISIRPKDGGRWLFLDGAGMRSDPERLWELFPDLPRDIKLPENTIEVIQPDPAENKKKRRNKRKKDKAPAADAGSQ